MRFLLVALAGLCPAHADVFKCESGGQVTFQDRPCDESSTQSEVSIRSAPTDYSRIKAREILQRLQVRTDAASPAVSDSTGAQWIASAQGLVRQMMKDPSSAEFRGDFHRSLNGVDDYVVCGEVNAKNSYGGYVGYKHYYQIAGELPQIAPDNSFEFEGYWLRYLAACTGEVPPA